MTHAAIWTKPTEDCFRGPTVDGQFVTLILLVLSMLITLHFYVRCDKNAVHGLLVSPHGKLNAVSEMVLYFHAKLGRAL